MISVTAEKMKTTPLQDGFYSIQYKIVLLMATLVRVYMYLTLTAQGIMLYMYEEEMDGRKQFTFYFLLV